MKSENDDNWKKKKGLEAISKGKSHYRNLSKVFKIQTLPKEKKNHTGFNRLPMINSQQYSKKSSQLHYTDK